MPSAHRKADIGSGHGCHFPPSPAAEGSPNVFSIAALMISTAYLDGCMDEVREEMDRRIKKGEYTEQRKNAVLARAQTN